MDFFVQARYHPVRTGSPPWTWDRGVKASLPTSSTYQEFCLVTDSRAVEPGCRPSPESGINQGSSCCLPTGQWCRLFQYCLGVPGGCGHFLRLRDG